MNETEIARLLQAAVAAQRAGDAATARRHYETILKIAPAQPQALNSLGVMALDAGDTDQAIAFHTRATAADPQAPVLWLNLAKAQRLANDDDGECASLTKALALDQLMFMALLRKAELHERRGETALAFVAWQGALATAPAERPPALAALIDHGAAFVRTQTARFAAELQSGLAEARAATDADLRRFDACMGHAVGQRRIYANECAATHFPFLPADEFFDRGHFPWLAALEAQTGAIRAELTALLESGAPGFEPYVKMAPGTPQNKWTPLDASTAWSAYHLWHYGKPIADAQARCPATVAALSIVPQLSLASRCPNVFFSILQPGARIPPHTGVTNIRTIVHLPLIVPEGCGFRVGGETREWKIGEAFAFDDTIEHEAWNDSSELRAVLIFDVWNPYLTEAERTMLGRYFEVADASGLNPGLAEEF